MAAKTRRQSTGLAGLFLGIGLGGFLDGILLHQIVQAHAMLSARIPLTSMANMKINMMADGLFHAVTWLATLIGVALLWKALVHGDGPAPSGTAFIGSMLAGWGWFNLVEGLIDHHILNLHHVVERLGLSIWDWLFLASGIVLIAAGHFMTRAAVSREA